MNSHIVVVEDDVDQLANYSYALNKKGFNVSGYESADEIQQALSGQPSLVLLDIHLGRDPDAGFGICQWLLDRYPGLPVIFLTSRTDEIDQIFGLRLGAWDYLTKPISTALLVEKVAAVLKRANRARNGMDTVLTDGPLIVDPDRAQVSFHGQPVSLTVTELAILEALMRAQGAVLTYDQLAERTRQTVVTNNTLSTHIKHIRRKLKLIDQAFDALVNVYGTGIVGSLRLDEIQFTDQTILFVPVFALVPWLGYQTFQKLQHFATEAQSEALRVLAQSLKPELDILSRPETIAGLRVTPEPMRRAPVIDGFFDEWPDTPDALADDRIRMKIGQFDERIVFALEVKIQLGFIASPYLDDQKQSHLTRFGAIDRWIIGRGSHSSGRGIGWI